MSDWDAVSKPVSDWDAVSRPERRKAAPPQRIDPSEGMSNTEKFLVGAGSSLNKAWEGLTDPFVGEETRKRRKEDRELYARNRVDGWGTAGEVVGDIAAYAPAALIPGGLPAQIAAGAGSSALLTPGDIGERAEAAGYGGAGAAVGNVLTRTLGRVFKPVGDKTADIIALERQGVEPTFGQAMASKGQQPGMANAIAGAVGRAEQPAMSTPFGGSVLRNSRKRALEQWQRASRAEALPPGAAAGAADTVDAARKAFSDAYEGVLQRHGLPYASVQYTPDMRRLSAGMSLTKDQRALAEQTFQEIRLKYLQNPTPGVQPTAAAAHGVESELKALARRFGSSQDPAQQSLGELYGKLADEYGQTWRGAMPAATRSEIAGIDRQYPAFAAVREAAKKVGTGVSEGDPNAYTPSVLLRAGRQVDKTPNKTRYLAGEAPLQSSAARAQRVLGDSVPDSGTAERTATGVALAAAPFTLGMSLAPGAAVAAYGSRPVQQYLMGRAAPNAQQAMLDLLRGAAPYAGAFGASQLAD